MRLLPILAAAALLPASLIAHADTIFNLGGSFTTNGTPSAPGGNLTGTITLNSASNGFSAIDATITNSTDTYRFTTVNYQFQGGYDNYVVEAFDGPIVLNLAIAFNNTLAGYAGSALCSVSSPCSNISNYNPNGDLSVQDDLFAGSVTPQALTATPEPSSFLLLGTGLLGIAGIARRRLA